MQSFINTEIKEKKVLGNLLLKTKLRNKVSPAIIELANNFNSSLSSIPLRERTLLIVITDRRLFLPVVSTNILFPDLSFDKHIYASVRPSPL